MRCQVSTIVILSLALNLSGCGTWSATRTSLKDLEGSKVRLTTTTGKRVAGKLVDADSLGYAMVHRKWWMEDSSVDTTTTAEIEVRRFSATNTLVVIPILAIAVAIEMSLLMRADWDD